MTPSFRTKRLSCHPSSSFASLWWCSSLGWLAVAPQSESPGLAWEWWVFHPIVGNPPPLHVWFGVGIGRLSVAVFTPTLSSVPKETNLCVFLTIPSLPTFQFLMIILIIFIAEVAVFVLGFIYRGKVGGDIVWATPLLAKWPRITRCMSHGYSQRGKEIQWFLLSFMCSWITPIEIEGKGEGVGGGPTAGTDTSKQADGSFLLSWLELGVHFGGQCVLLCAMPSTCLLSNHALIASL